MHEMQGAPESVRGLAEACARYVELALTVKLDYSSDTLPILDHYLKSVPAGATQELLALIGPTAGAYFGEVIRRELSGACWYCPDGDYQAWRLVFERLALRLNPIGAALEAAMGTDVPEWGACFDVAPEDQPAIAESLKRLADVRESDFYRLAVRFDILSHCVSVLAARRDPAPN